MARFMSKSFGLGRWLGVLAAVAALSARGQENFNLSTTTKYTGRAVALRIELPPERPNASPPAPVLMADSGAAPITGGEIHSFYNDAAPVPGVTAQALDAVTVGAGGRNRTRSSLVHLDARLGLHHITALWVESEAMAATRSHSVTAQGKSTVEGLVVDGQPATITGQTNQTLTFPDGYLVINEQSGASAAHFSSLTVNALHLYVVGSGHLTAASARAEVIYAPLP